MQNDILVLTIAAFELGKTDGLVIVYHSYLTMPMFTYSLLISGSHILEILGKDPMDCLLFESACLMGRSILQEGSEISAVELRHRVNKYYIFFMKENLKHLGTQHIPLANWNKLAFPAMSSLTAALFQSRAGSEGPR